jgi:MATE family multidrug resistance protein
VLVITLISLGVHALLATFLTHSLGFVGVAISQTVTHAVTFVLLTWHVRRVTGIGIMSLRMPQRLDVRRTLALGLPTALVYGSEAGFFAVIALLVGRFGATALAAHNVVNQLVYIVFMLAVGLSHGTSVVISRARAVGGVSVRRIGHTGLALGAVVVLIMGVFQLSAPHAALFVFSRGATARAPEVTQLAAQMLAIAVGFQLFDCFQNVGGALLRALHRPRVTLVMTLIGYWCVGLPAAWYFGAQRGPLGVWWGLAAGLLTTAVLIIAAFERLAVSARSDNRA